MDELFIDFERRADEILREELEKFGIMYDSARVILHDHKTVGVQGDKRTYGHCIEVDVIYNGRFVQDQENQKEFMVRLSNRLTNEISGINRVVYALRVK